MNIIYYGSCFNKSCGGIEMGKDIIISKGDIIADNGVGVYIITQDDKQISRNKLNQLIKDKIIYFDRHQWGVDHFLVK